MKRGDIATVVLSGNLGKPRPAIIVQSDLFSETSSVVILPTTSTITSIAVFRLLIHPTSGNGLRLPSHIMIDKVANLARDKVGKVIGHLDDEGMLEVTRQLALFLGIR